MLGSRLLFVATLCLPAVAQARGVGVLPVEGNAKIAPRITAAIEKALAKQGDVDVAKAAEFEGITASELSSIQQKAAELGVDLVIATQLQKKGRRWTANIRILDAATTQTLRTWSPRAKRSKRLAYIIERGLMKRVSPFVGATITPRTVSVLTVSGLKAHTAERALGAQPSLQVMPLRVATKLAPNADLESMEGRIELARRAGLDALVDVTVEGRRPKKARIVVIDGATGEIKGAAEGEAKSARRAVQAALPQLITLLESTNKEAPAPPAPEPVLPPPAPPPPVAATPAKLTDSPSDGAIEMAETKKTPVRLKGRSLAYQVRFETGIAGRNLSYNDDLFGALAPYSLPAGPQIGGRLRVFPGAFITRGFARNFGIGFHGHGIVGVTTKDPNERESSTSAYDLGGDLRGRLPIGAHDVSLFAGMGHDRYALDTVAPFEVPQTNYTYARVGLEGTVRVSNVEVELQGAWRPVLSMGEIKDADWFPRASVLAFEAGLSAVYSLDIGLQFGLRADMRRYAFSFSPEPGDNRVAGGAADQRWSAGLVLGWAGKGR